MGRTKRGILFLLLPALLAGSGIAGDIGPATAQYSGTPEGNSTSGLFKGFAPASRPGDLCSRLPQSATRTRTFVDTAKTKEFMITFDDGPLPGVTPSIVDELKQFRVNGEPVRAGFFMVGKNAPWLHIKMEYWRQKGSIEDYETITRYVADAGHLIGNHTQHHAWFYAWEYYQSWDQFAFDPIREYLRRYESKVDFVKDEIVQCNAAIQKATGVTPLKIFRPPYLDNAREIHEAAEQLGFTIIFGQLTGDSNPYARLGDIQKRLLGILNRWKKEEPVVLVFHPEPMRGPDKRTMTYYYLSEIINFLLKNGFALAHFDPDRLSQQRTRPAPPPATVSSVHSTR